STRIKAVLIGEGHTPIASGSYGWENRYENGFWTYNLEDVWTGLQESYRKPSKDLRWSLHSSMASDLLAAHTRKLVPGTPGDSLVRRTGRRAQVRADRLTRFMAGRRRQERSGWSDYNIEIYGCGSAAPAAAKAGERHRQ